MKEELKQAIKEHTEFAEEQCIIQLALLNTSILRHADPEIMKQAGWESSEWINVEDKPKAGYYLCYDPNLQGNKVEVYHYKSYNDSWYLGADTVHPSHYKPLPQPPKQ